MRDERKAFAAIAAVHNRSFCVQVSALAYLPAPWSHIGERRNGCLSCAVVGALQPADEL